MPKSTAVRAKRYKGLFLKVTPAGKKFLQKNRSLLREPFVPDPTLGPQSSNPKTIRKGVLIKRVDRYIEHHLAEFDSLTAQRRTAKRPGRLANPLGVITTGGKTYTLIRLSRGKFSPSNEIATKIPKAERRRLFAEVRATYESMLKKRVLPMDIRARQILIRKTKGGRHDFLLIDTSTAPLGELQLRTILESMGEKKAATNMGNYIDREGNSRMSIEDRDTFAVDWYKKQPAKMWQRIQEFYFNWAMGEIRKKWGLD